MQSHASRHVASEFLKDRHPDLSDPFPKVCGPLSNTFENCHDDAHLQEVIFDEIAVAYGRRGIQKVSTPAWCMVHLTDTPPSMQLKDVLALPDESLADENRAHALRVLLGMLTTQEHKTDAVAEGACEPLTALVRRCLDPEVLRLSCEALGSLAMVQQGREAIVKAEGVQALTDALETSPEAAAGALRYFAMSSQGVKLLHPTLDLVVPALVALIERPKDEGVSLRACENAAATLSSLASTDDGIVACLAHGVPKCIVGLMERGVTGDPQL